jgi:hypothetical protein
VKISPSNQVTPLTIMLKTRLLQLTFERVISSKRYNFDDHIDISSCAYGRGRGVGHEQTGCAAADEHESVAERSQGVCH